MFCSQCGETVKDKDKYCSNCGKGLSSQPSEESKPAKPVKSFLQYKKAKGTEWKEKVSTSADKKKDKHKDEEVIINIALMEWSEKEQELKPKRGKKLPLRIPSSANYSVLLKAAKEKWKNFQKNLYHEEETYHLLYEDTSRALLLPGCKKESFSLKRYKEEIGKDFKRITMFLCTHSDLQSSEEYAQQDREEETAGNSEDEKPSKRFKMITTDYNSDDDHLLLNDDPLGKLSTFQSTSSASQEFGSAAKPSAAESQSQASSSSKPPSLSSVTTSIDLTLPPSAIQIDLDAQLASHLQSIYDQQETDSPDPNTCISSTDKDMASDMTKIDNECSVVKALAEKIEKPGQLFIVIRRGCKLSRVIDVWKRALKKDPSCRNKRVMVSFSGEEGIDSGAMALEFFTLYLPNIGLEMFPGGSPVDSILSVQNSSFLTCGQIAAASLAQGGPPPNFLDESVFKLMLNLNLRPDEIDPSKHLTESDKTFLKSVQDNLTSHIDTIIENGYTGVIDEQHSEQIIKSITISIVSKRLLYLREFMDGLKSFSLAEIIQSHPESCKSLFVKSSQSKEVDANFVFSILHPIYAQEGSSRRNIEESVMDFFQDFLFMLEDERNIPGYTEAISWNYGIESGAEVSNTDQQSEQFQSPDLSPPGILGWLTGQKHVPIGEEALKISVHFNHDCGVDNPKHRICFPIVGACAREITLPVSHMKTKEEFKEVFLLAFCKGQSFGKA